MSPIDDRTSDAMASLLRTIIHSHSIARATRYMLACDAPDVEDTGTREETCYRLGGYRNDDEC